jgi:hypothetical protein
MCFALHFQRILILLNFANNNLPVMTVVVSWNHRVFIPTRKERNSAFVTTERARKPSREFVQYVYGVAVGLRPDFRLHFPYQSGVLIFCLFVLDPFWFRDRSLHFHPRSKNQSKFRPKFDQSSSFSKRAACSVRSPCSPIWSVSATQFWAQAKPWSWASWKTCQTASRFTGSFSPGALARV